MNILKKSFGKIPKETRTDEIFLPPSEAILENMMNGFFKLDRNWNILYVNKQLEYNIGKTRHEIIGKSVWKVFPAILDTKFEFFYRKAMVERREFFFEEYFEPTQEWLEVRVSPYQDGIIGYVTNITNQKKNEQLLEHVTLHDALTNLPNRSYFEKRISQLWEHSIANQKEFSLIYFDVDRFKNINDTFGHSLGDQLIKEISQRIVNVVDDKGFVARMGGDQFAVLMDDRLDKNAVQTLARSIIQSMENDPFCINQHEFFVTTSIGISFYPQHGQDVETIIKNADIALYSSKARGINNYTVFNPIMDIYSYKRFSLERELRVAINEKMLEVHYQPRVEPHSGRIVSAEALVRWKHPEWGMLLPGEFISIAEETGLIEPLTKYVLRTVCKQIQFFEAEGVPFVPVSVNIPARQFFSEEFTNDVIELLKETKAKAEWLEFEITESSLLENQAIVESAIKKLKSLGIKIAIDDFGIEYSSLAYLTKFQVDIIKIDRYFIRNIINSPSNVTVTKAIIHLAHELGLKTVAEGVETTEQLNFLKQQECDEIQGYIYSKPVPATEFLSLLNKKILLPNGGKKEVPVENRRKYFRVDFFFPLSAQMTIVKIKNKDMNLGNTEVLVEDIGIGGLRFLTHLSFAVTHEVILEFETIILGKKVIECGYIAWKQEIEENLFRYGIEFTSIESERNHLVPLLNRLALNMKKNPLVPDSQLVKTDRFAYIKRLN
ncbi:EAL domain-containing protein [Caldibacillus lycopersici]|uniref:EAL domain-containing protein n=1 Tax=Perspicuibacillus lycopersici TaxID=1325689 RepID=A0AAE3LM65_9BACI|nr:EAL domain-containing protein [Perspicuibacillus lycopersici]MCU9613225.1 EAL domain-containing protein [Perspicuibacillus lycopersici]